MHDNLHETSGTGIGSMALAAALLYSGRRKERAEQQNVNCPRPRDTPAAD